MVLLHLFLSFVRISSCAIGGAYSFLPLREHEIVEKYQWLSKPEFLDILGMVKSFLEPFRLNLRPIQGTRLRVSMAR